MCEIHDIYIEVNEEAVTLTEVGAEPVFGGGVLRKVNWMTRLLCILMSSKSYGPTTFWSSNHIPPSAMSRLPGPFHSEMRHHTEVEHSFNFRCSRTLTIIMLSFS